MTLTDSVTPLGHTDGGPAVPPASVSQRGPWTAGPDLDQLAAAYVAALGEVEDVTRDQQAQMGSYSYRYAGLGSVLSAVRPVLAAHGLAVFQMPEVDEDGDVVVTTTVLHASGQFLVAPALRMPAGDTPQQIGSAITYARRYALMAVLGMATEDDDGAAASVPRKLAADVVARFRQAAGDHGLTDEDVRIIVHDATGGRTVDPSAVLEREGGRLRAAFNAYVAAPVPAETPPDEPRGPTSGSEPPDAAETP